MSLQHAAQPRLDVFSDRLAHRVVHLAQARKRLRVGEAGLLHDDRGLDVPVRLLEQPVGVVVVDAGHDVDDAAGAILQLLRAGVDVDHQVAVGLADANHRAGGQHVEHQLGCGAAFSRVDPAMTSAPTPGAIVRSTNVCSSVAGSQVTKMMRAPAWRARVSAPRTNCVMPLADTPMTMSFFVGSQAGDRAGALLVVVFDAFLRGEDGVAPAGHDRLHELGIGAEGRRHLRRLEDAEPAARAGADEHDAAALPKRRGDHLDRRRRSARARA